MIKQLVTVIGLFFCVNSILAQSGWRVYQAPNDLPDSTVVQYSVQGDSLIVTDELGFYIQTRNSREFFYSNDGYEEEPFLSVTANTNNEICVLYDHADSLHIYENHQLKRKVAIGGWWSKCRDDNITIVPGLDGYFYANCDGYVYVPNGDVLDLISGSRRMGNMIQGPDNSVYAIKNNDSTFYTIRNGSIIDSVDVPGNFMIHRVENWSSNNDQIVFTSMFNDFYTYKPDSTPKISLLKNNDKTIHSFALDDKGRVWFTNNYLINRLSLADTALDVEQVSGFKMSHNPGNTDFIKTFGDEVLAEFQGGYMTATTDVQFHEIDYLTLNGFSIPVYSEGSYGKQESLPNSFEFATYNGKSILYMNSLWLTGENKGTGLDHFAGSYVPGYENNTFDYTKNMINPGPYQTELNYYRNYRTFKVTRAQIDDHIANYSSSSYETPEDIREWPAHGNPNAGESTCIAPFVDVNNDEIYDPNDGDYPQIRGDQAVYTVFTDFRDNKKRTVNPLGVEGHLMMYGFESNDPKLSKTFFLNYRLINISQNSYENFITGTDHLSGVGDYSDDLVGCDTLNDFYYYYNEDDYDDTTSEQIGFGDNPPSLGIVPLNKELYSFTGWSGNHFIDTENPGNGEYDINYLKGLKNGGSPFYANSYRAVTTSQAYGDSTRYLFTGDPAQDSGWTNYRDSTLSSDPLLVLNGIVSGLNHGDFNSGDTVEVDYAITIAENTGNMLYSEVADLRTQVQDIQQWYNNQQFDPWEYDCNAYNSVTDRDLTENSSFKLYPNPAENRINVEFSEKLSKPALIEVYNAVGTLVRSEYRTGNKVQVQLSSLNSGYYLIRVKTESIVESKPLIVR